MQPLLKLLVLKRQVPVVDDPVVVVPDVDDPDVVVPDVDDLVVPPKLRIRLKKASLFESEEFSFGLVQLNCTIMKITKKAWIKTNL